MRARLHHLVIDCPDPRALAEFYARLLDQPVTYDSEDFVVVAESDRTSGLAFQRATGHRAPTWPSPGRRSRCISTSWSRTPRPPGRTCCGSGRPPWTATSTPIRPVIRSA